MNTNKSSFTSRTSFQTGSSSPLITWVFLVIPKHMYYRTLLLQYHHCFCKTEFVVIQSEFRSSD